MKKRITATLLLSMIAAASPMHAELEGDLWAYFSESMHDHQIPIMVTVVDHEGESVRGAFVALKRLTPNGYTVEDVKRNPDSRTDLKGNATVTLSCKLLDSKDGSRELRMLGAITIVADGFAVKVIELEKFFPDSKITLHKNRMPWIKVKLKK